MALPHFLIIGAMKSGTTSLYRDLLANPRIFMPIDKEPHTLCEEAVLSSHGREQYAHLFARARSDQVCGEASTGYTKAPDHAGVPERARAVLGPDVRLIYLVRNPVARILSHHHHAATTGVIETTDIREALERHPELLNWSRYAMQARLWINVFGRDALFIIRFEDYIADRVTTVERLSRFLGVEPDTAAIDVNTIHNRSADKRVAGRALDRFINSAAYRMTLRPLLSHRMKDSLRRVLLPKAKTRIEPPDLATVDRMIDALGDDLDELRTMLDMNEPVWTRESMRAKAGGTPTSRN